MPASFNKEDNHLSTGSCEYFCSGSGIEKRAFKSFGKKLTTKEVFDSYATDQRSQIIINEGIEALGSTLAIAIAMLNPNSIVIGGSVARHNK
jgi:glucokinase